MELLFNKNNNGSEELSAITSNYYESNQFDRIKVKVTLAQEKVALVISLAVMNKAIAHYKSDRYMASDETEAELLLTGLVQHIQMPVAYLATHEYYKANELTHDDTGRKMKIDATTERTPWQWQIDRDDELSIRTYYRSLDRLIAFLDANANSIDEWKNSDARAVANSLFVRSAGEFSRWFPIDDSGVFYYAVVPFIRKVERERINPALGELAQTLKDARLAGTETDTQKDIIESIQNCIPLFVMAEAVKRLSIQILPDGVVQNYFSDRMDRKASQAAALAHIKELSALFYADAEKAFDAVKRMVANEETLPPDISDFVAPNDSANKYFRT